MEGEGRKEGVGMEGRGYGRGRDGRSGYGVGRDGRRRYGGGMDGRRGYGGGYVNTLNTVDGGEKITVNILLSTLATGVK